ncbi:hypothetical protein HOY80DRAFT_1074195 [Tuber brumale]|nr:hypothetical protein HOY80DRAFT_1074195 [Tuber brumale]
MEGFALGEIPEAATWPGWEGSDGGERKEWISHLNPNGGGASIIERGTLMGFETIAYTRSIILKHCINDVGEAFQSLSTANAHGPANPDTQNGPCATIAPRPNHECPMFVTGATDGAQYKDSCHSSQNYKSPSYLQRFMDESSEIRESLGHSYVASCHGSNICTVTNPTLPRTTLHDMCTPTGATECQVVPRSHRKRAFRDATKGGCDLRPLGAKSRTRRSIKIGDGNKWLKSMLIAIKNAHSDGVRAIVKDEVTAFLRLGRRREGGDEGRKSWE